VVNLWKYRDVMVKMGNYEKQLKRITKFKGLGEKKLGKKGVFSKGATYLKDAGGGDADNLTCNGASTNNAAKTLINLTTFVENCSDHINTVCNTSMPTPPPENETKPCTKAIDSFKAIMGNCSKDKTDGAKLCTCIGDKSGLANLTKVINDCDLSKKYLKPFVTYKSSCIKAFGDCRKYEDEVGAAVATCGKTDKGQKKKVAATTKNLGTAKEVSKEIDKKLGSRSGRHARDARATVTCSVWSETCATFTKKFTAKPDRTDLGDLGTSILNDTVGTCSEEDKKKLTATKTMIATSIEKVTELVALLQEALVQLTGTTLSAAGIASEAAVIEAEASATTVASAGRKRAAHANLLKRLRVAKS